MSEALSDDDLRRVADAAAAGQVAIQYFRLSAGEPFPLGDGSYVNVLNMSEVGVAVDPVWMATCGRLQAERDDALARLEDARVRLVEARGRLEDAEDALADVLSLLAEAITVAD